METKGLGAGSYPEPKEQNMKEIKVKLTVEYTTVLEVPSKWDDERIEQDVLENMDDYIFNATMDNWEVEINEQS